MDIDRCRDGGLGGGSIGVTGCNGSCYGEGDDETADDDLHYISPFGYSKVGCTNKKCRQNYIHDTTIQYLISIVKSTT